MKKVISLFLVFVSVLILAHAVIPHHHHNGISFISVATCPVHDDAHENCMLTKVYVRLSNDKHTLQLLDFNFDLLPCVFWDVIIPQTDYKTCLTFLQLPHFQFDYTEFITCSTGLRAPPLQLQIKN